LKARPEPIQLEHRSDASFLVKLLVLSANVRLDWKVMDRYKCYNLFGLIISNKGKKFYNIDTRPAKMVAERKDHVFKDLAAEDPDQQPMEIESYCVGCGENVRPLCVH
jgi:hypothetical protein